MRAATVLLLCGVVVAACGGSDAIGSSGSDASVADGGGGDGRTAAGDSGVEGCGSNADCPGGKCHPVKKVCVDCTQDDHCPDGAKCVSGECVTGVVCSPGKFQCLPEGMVQACNEVGSGWLEPESCDDEVDCTKEQCTDGGGCQHTPDHLLCDDGNECTDDVCKPGGCANQVKPECSKGGLAEAQPASIVFPATVPGDQMSQKNVTIQNIGLGDLVITGASIEDPEGVFLLLFPPSTFRTERVFSPGIVVEPGNGVSLTVVFAPEQLGDYSGMLNVSTDDPTRPGGSLSVSLSGKAVANNCLAVNPLELGFGGKEVGVVHTLDIQIKNCGDGLVPVFKVYLAGDSAPEFAIEGMLKPPYDLDAGQSTVVTVGFKPTEPNQAYQGTLVVENAAPKNPTIEIPLTGLGIKGEATCPIAVVSYGGAAQVEPFKPVSLSGKGSYGLAGSIVTYLWDIVQPWASFAGYLPSGQAPEVQVTPLVTGQYVFKLAVVDDKGTTSCNVASKSLLVVPEQDIYVELVWHTPGDPNEQDAGPGSDMDLHLTSPLAAGPDRDKDGKPDGWFDGTNDCWSKMSEPEWGNPDPKALDNPKMLLSDKNGAGPEAIALNHPADGTYQVGVYCPGDAGMGPSSVRVHVYAHAGKALTAGPVTLKKGDLWDAARIVVTNQGFQVTVNAAKDAEGNPIVLEGYPAP